ncbi:MAG TPA: hypothetical protein VHZ32_15885 [Rhizomicrobium sp.]|jgi:hypothetical protein|nr:hypothetical protein [Rhizomicrobium sp.]
MSRLMMAFTIGGCLMASMAWGQNETVPADYPDPQCARPQVQLIKPANTYSNHIDDSAPVGSYNQKVRLYNGQARDYDACMHAYIDTANAELKRVQTDANDRIHQIANDANARLKTIEGKIAAAVHDANQVSQDEAEKHRQ